MLQTRFNPIASSLHYQAQRVQRQHGLVNSLRELRAHMLQAMDLNRFRTVYAIGATLNAPMFRAVVDDFLFFIAAEEFSARKDNTRLCTYMLASDALIKHITNRTPITLQTANAVQLSAEAGMRALPDYSDPALQHGSLELNKLYAMRGDPAAVHTDLPKRNILQLRP